MVDAGVGAAGPPGSLREASGEASAAGAGSEGPYSLLNDQPIENVGLAEFPFERDLKGKLNNPSNDCIGVIGFPGTGKTALMAKACKGTFAPEMKPMTGYIVSVPAGADSSEIARQLVLSLCGEILGRQFVTPVRGVPDALPRKVAVISSASAIVVGSVLLVLSASGIRINSQMDLGSVFVLAGFIGLLSWLLARVTDRTGWVTLRRPANDSSKDAPVPYPRELCKRAAALVDTLEAERRFETTVTSGWTGGLATSTGLAVGTSGSVSKKLLPTPLSALRESYTQLIAEVAADRNLIVGIDELDKYSPGADIDKILDELRDFLKLSDVLSTRGLRHRCRYLIALAENTQSIAHRPRVIDIVVRCESLTFPQVKILIESQTKDIPHAFAELCYAASGGLPLAFKNTTDLVVKKWKAQPHPSLTSICHDIIETELQSLAAQLRSAARSQPDWNQQKQLFEWAELLSSKPLEVSSILKAAGEIRAVTTNGHDVTGDGNANLHPVTDRAAVLSYFCLTLIEFFTDSHDAEKPGCAPSTDPDDSALRRLSEARRLIDLATYGPAWADIEYFRSSREMTDHPALGGSADVPGPQHQDLAEP